MKIRQLLEAQPTLECTNEAVSHDGTTEQMETGLLFERVKKPSHRKSEFVAPEMMQTRSLARRGNQTLFIEAGRRHSEPGRELPARKPDPRSQGKGRNPKTRLALGPLRHRRADVISSRFTTRVRGWG